MISLDIEQRVESLEIELPKMLSQVKEMLQKQTAKVLDSMKAIILSTR